MKFRLLAGVAITAVMAGSAFARALGGKARGGRGGDEFSLGLLSPNPNLTLNPNLDLNLIPDAPY